MGMSVLVLIPVLEGNGTANWEEKENYRACVARRDWLNTHVGSRMWHCSCRPGDFVYGPSYRYTIEDPAWALMFKLTWG